jgi:mannosyl-3-phosphoglycerate synthase
MRIEIPKTVERFGAIRFGGLQKVFELDSGPAQSTALSQPSSAIKAIPYEEMSAIFEQMAIVVPVMNEKLKLVEGVLCGIPHQCLTIIVSNSPQTPVDRFGMEKDALHDFCLFVGKKAMIAHQKDPLLAKAFQEANYSSILSDDGSIRDGKAEGMLIGTMLAKLAGKKYIGFVDADNYFPGAVEEYIREYAAGFIMGRSPYTMVRIAWQSKPKIVASKLFFRKWGRTSHRTNQLLNQLLTEYTGFETEIIKTGNAGEHALSMDLAMNLDYSYGYSIEPYHIINLIERYGGINEAPVPEIMKQGIDLFQIESRNPHLHEAGEDEHVQSMSYLAMQVIYHSSVCPKSLKRDIKQECKKSGFVKEKEDVVRPHYFPALNSIDVKKFQATVEPTSYARLAEEGVGLLN